MRWPIGGPRPRSGARRRSRPRPAPAAQRRGRARRAAPGVVTLKSIVKPRNGAAGLLLEGQHVDDGGGVRVAVPCTSKVRTMPSRSASVATRREARDPCRDWCARAEPEPGGRSSVPSGRRRSRRCPSGPRDAGTDGGRRRAPPARGPSRSTASRKARSSSAEIAGKPRQAWWPMTSRAGPQPASATRWRIEVAGSSPARKSGVREKSVVPRVAIRPTSTQLLGAGGLEDGLGDAGGPEAVGEGGQAVGRPRPRRRRRCRRRRRRSSPGSPAGGPAGTTE